MGEPFLLASRRAGSEQARTSLQQVRRYKGKTRRCNPVASPWFKHATSHVFSRCHPPRERKERPFRQDTALKFDRSGTRTDPHASLRGRKQAFHRPPPTSTPAGLATIRGAGVVADLTARTSQRHEQRFDRSSHAQRTSEEIRVSHALDRSWKTETNLFWCTVWKTGPAEPPILPPGPPRIPIRSAAKPSGQIFQSNTCESAPRSQIARTMRGKTRRSSRRIPMLMWRLAASCSHPVTYCKKQEWGKKGSNQSGPR